MRSLQPSQLSEHYPQLQSWQPQHCDCDSRVPDATTYTSYETVEDEFWTLEYYGGVNRSVGRDESSS